MAKNSVLGHPDNVPRLAREGFNLNQIFTFTASTGMLLPVWYDMLNPGETIKGAPSFLLRSDHFLAPAMADIDCFVDLFFVPMQKILSPFGEWFYQIDDLRSDFLTPDGFTEYLPLCTSIIDSHNPFAGMTASTFNRFLNFNKGGDYDTFGFGLHRLLQHFGYNPQSLFYNLVKTYAWQDEEAHYEDGIVDGYRYYVEDVSCPDFSPYLFCAYQGIYYDYYRNSDFEANNVKAYNLDTYFNNDPEIDMDDIFDQDTDNRLDIFALRYRWKTKDYFTASRISPLASAISMLPGGLDKLSQVNQWLTNGIYGMQTRLDSFSSADPNVPSTAYTQFGTPLHKLSNGSVGAALWADPAYNSSYGYIDDPDNTPSGAASFGDDGVLEDGDGVSVVLHTPHTHNSSDPSFSLSTARIRTMFALEKLQRVTARAGKHYDDQTLAHFGFKVQKGMSGEVYKIGSWHTQLGVQKVTSTADTQGAALGEQAAVGYAILDARKKGFKFTAPCHGIVMCIWSCAPRYKYIGAIDKLEH